jgi:hypothetical protein
VVEELPAEGLTMAPEKRDAREKAEHAVYDPGRVAQLSDREVCRILVGRIREGVDRYYPEVGDRPVTVTGKAWGGQETARTFRIEIGIQGTGFKKILFAKLCPVFERINPSAMEYETLRQLYERMPAIAAKCRVSRPIDFFPELNAYAMESVGTHDFKSYLLRKNSSWKSDEQVQDLFAVVGDCGTWLRTFHSISKSTVKRRFFAELLIKGINEDYSYEALWKYAFSKTFFRELEAFMAGLRGLDDKYDMPCAKWHWDFTPGHVYLDGEKVSVIDITGIEDTPIFEDVGRFLSAMTMVNTIPKYPFYDRLRADTGLCDAFLKSYLGNAERDSEMLTMFANIYKFKYLIIWFFTQHSRVSSKINPLIGDAFVNLSQVRLYETTILRNIAAINKTLRCLT